MARSTSEIRDAAQAIAETGGRASAVGLDVANVDATRAWFVDQPPYDILINNAGANRPKPFVDVSLDDFDSLFGLNVRAAFFAAQAMAARLIAAGRPGSIINMSSQMGHIGAALRSVYCACKHALEGMTKALAAELGPHGIRVNTICPTFIETPMTRPFLSDAAFRADVLPKIKLGRLGQVEDVMGAVVFLPRTLPR